MAAVKIVGTEKFHETALRLREAGDGKLAREMSRNMKTAADPIVNQMRSNVIGLSSQAKRSGARAKRTAFLLSRRKNVTARVGAKVHAGSGLRSTTARATKVRVKAGARSASVRIYVDKAQLPPDQRKLPGHMNTGRWRHPVMGDRKTWVTQTVSPKEWFDRPARQHGQEVRDRAVKAVDDIIAKI